jgi:hypothetical protein
MNYRSASKQQLLAERARLTTAYRKAEQRLGSNMFAGGLGGGATRPNRGSTRAPQHEAERLAAQLAEVEAELQRRAEKEAEQTKVLPAGAADEG